MTDWHPVEEMDHSWPYRFKWAYSQQKDQAHVWRIPEKDGDGRLTHREEFAQTFGHPAKTLSGDQLGNASYIPEERMYDGTLVAPPEIQIHTYYGGIPHDKVYEWFLHKFPDVIVRRAQTGRRVEGKVGGIERLYWTWSPPDLIIGTKDRSAKAWTGNVLIENGIATIEPDRPETPHEGLAKLKTDLGERYPKARIVLPSTGNAQTDASSFLERKQVEERHIAALQWADTFLPADESDITPEQIANGRSILKSLFGLSKKAADGPDMDGAMYMLQTPIFLAEVMDEMPYSDPEKRRQGSRRSALALSQRKTDFIRTTKAASGCVVCGEIDPVVLVLHHPADVTKHAALRGGKGKPRRGLQQLNWDDLREEVAKCEVWCFNCHARHHDAETNRIDPSAILPDAVAMQDRTHCPQGHEYTEANTYYSKKGRNCRQCMREASRSWKARQKQVQAGADLDGAMVALFIPKEVGRSIKVRGGETVENLHITLAYFAEKAADRDDWDEVAKIVETIANQTPPLVGKIGGYGVFQNDDNPDVLWASPNLPGLEDLRQKVVEAVEDAGFKVSDEHGWTPHITIKYDFKGKLPRVKDENELAIKELSFARGTDQTHFVLCGDFVKETSWEMSEWSWPGTHRFVTDGHEILLEPEDQSEWHARSLGGLQDKFQRIYPESTKATSSGWAIPTADGMGYGVWAPKVGYGGNDELGLDALITKLDRELKKPTHLVEDWGHITDPKMYASTHRD